MRAAVQRLRGRLPPGRVAFILILLGAGLRLRQYLFCRCLWVDECILALNLIDRTLSEALFAGLNAPDGFILLTKLSIGLLGTSEWAFRLAPFLMGIATLPILYVVGRRAFNERTAIVALAFAVFSIEWLYYSNEFKQYMPDAAIALLLYCAVFVRWRGRADPRPWKVLIAAAIGAVAIWFSHPAIFVLAAIGIALAVQCLRDREWSKLRSLVIIGGAWLLSFAASYFISLRHLGAREGLLRYWSDAFMPFPPRSFSEVGWLGDRLLQWVSEAGGFELPAIALFAFVLGILQLLRKDRIALIAFIFPILFALIASALHKYPFHGRLLLFTTPMLFLIAAHGACSLTRVRGGEMAGWLLILFMLLPMAKSAARVTVKPFNRDDVRAVLEYVVEHRNPSDRVFFHGRGVRQLRYYEHRYRSDLGDVAIGPRGRESYLRMDLIIGRAARRSGGRTWVIFTHTIDETESLIVEELDRVGERLDQVKAEGASGYLYRFPPQDVRSTGRGAGAWNLGEDVGIIHPVASDCTGSRQKERRPPWI